MVFVLFISQRVSSSNKSTQFGSTKETLLKRLFTKMWAECRETTKEGQCSRSRKKTGSIATADPKEQRCYDLEPEACVKRATW